MDYYIEIAFRNNNNRNCRAEAPFSLRYKANDFFKYHVKCLNLWNYL